MTIMEELLIGEKMIMISTMGKDRCNNTLVDYGELSIEIMPFVCTRTPRMPDLPAQVAAEVDIPAQGRAAALSM